VTQGTQGTDRAGLQCLLWIRSNPRTHKVEFFQKDLAAQLGVNKFTMSRIITKMVEEGRLVKLSGHPGRGISEYVVIDPAGGLELERGATGQ